MPSRPFQPGFRIDAIDALVLVVGALGAVLLARVEWWMGLVIGLTVGHFFMFCNVFRLARPLELAWSAIFLVLAGSTIVTGQPGWSATLGLTLVATLLVIVAQVRKPSYHGIGWRRLNPTLPAWWEAQGGVRNAESNKPQRTASSSHWRRLAWLLACIFAGLVIAVIGNSLWGGALWYIAVPAAVASGWLFLADPSACEPAPFRQAERPADDETARAP